MKQIVFQPTHRQGNTIDLCFTNDDSLVHSYNCIDVLNSVSHHKHIEFTCCADIGLASRANMPKTCPERPKLAKFNFFISTIWPTTLCNVPSHTLLEIIVTLLVYVVGSPR